MPQTAKQQRDTGRRANERELVNIVLDICKHHIPKSKLRKDKVKTCI